MKSVKLLALFFLLYLSALAGVREPVMADKFYPGDPVELQRMVSGFIANVPSLPVIDGQIIAILVPHAGYVYSGQTAAYAFKLLENRGYNRVILCGPSHQYGFRGLSVYGPGMQWKTPLGILNCDDTLCNQLLKFRYRELKLFRRPMPRSTASRLNCRFFKRF